MQRSIIFIHVVVLVCFYIVGTTAAPLTSKSVGPKAVGTASINPSNIKSNGVPTAASATTSTTVTTAQNANENLSQQNPGHPNAYVAETLSGETLTTTSAEPQKKKGLSHTAQLLNSALMDIFDSLGDRNKEKA